MISARESPRSWRSGSHSGRDGKMTRLGAAVVGLGVGREHVRAYAQLPESELVAVCDQNPERLKAVGDEYGVATYTDVADLLRDDRVEVVSVATPHPSHAVLAIAALEA